MWCCRYALWPQSTNMIWRHGRQTYLTAKAKEFRKMVEHETLLASMQGSMPGVALKGDLHVTLTFWPPNRRKRDLDNLLKSILDAMTWAGVWLDDSQVKQLTASLEAPNPGDKTGSFEIVIEELEDAA